ncbi:MAG: hypothetical protein KAU90_00170, partial [Sulfurovaceae bacterium]|nr:hypothetical protein [Sulfurovaceae bacterium]
VEQLPESVKAKAAAKAKVIQSILPIFDGLKAEVNFQTLIVSISDGGKTLKEAFHQAAPTLVTSNTVDINSIISSVMKSNLISESQNYIKNVITTTNSNIISIQGENYTDIKVVEEEAIKEITPTPTPTPTLAVLSISKASFGDRNVNISNGNMTAIELSKSGDSNLSKLFDINLIDTTTTKNFNSTDAKLDINIVNDYNTSRKINFTISGIKIEATNPSTFKTTFDTTTHLKFVDDVNGIVKIFNGNMANIVVYNELVFDLNTIINNSNNSTGARAKIKDIEDYLQNISNDRNFTINITLSGLNFETFRITGKGTVRN